MDELIRMFLGAQHAFGERVHAIAETQWQAPTPCTDWTVLALVDHLVSEQRWLPPLLHGLDLASAGEVVAGARTLPADGGVGANHAELWDEAAVAAADAVVDPGVLERQVELSRGRTPAREYLYEMALDAVVHAWDLGAAIGFAEQLPDELVAFASDAVGKFGDLSSTGMFAAPVDVPDDASPQDRLIGATGRDPHWSAP